MVHIAESGHSFFDNVFCEGRKLVLYGIGFGGEAVFPFLENISYVCDRKASEGEQFFHGIRVIDVSELVNKSEKYSILVCVSDRKKYMEITERIRGLEIDAIVYDMYDNVSFDCMNPIDAYREKRELKNINIVLPKEGWITGKIASRLCEYLNKSGYHAQISSCIDVTADINHHLLRKGFEPLQDNRDTLFITHVENAAKLEDIKKQLQVARMGICMSRFTMDMLVSYGIPRHKLCYINPAHDGVIKPKKYVLGMTHKSYEAIDNRKRDSVLIDILKPLNPDFFEIKIMGPNWENIVANVRKMGFSVEYYNDFDYDTYINLVPTFDYYLYWGYDEASMGYLDALTAGVKTLVTPQGYHLDAIDGVTYLCKTARDFSDTLLGLEAERKKIINSVSSWTWESYAEKHVEVWKYILGDTDGIYKNQHLYEDGIFSVFV